MSYITQIEEQSIPITCKSCTLGQHTRCITKLYQKWDWLSERPGEILKTFFKDTNLFRVSTKL